MSQEKKLLILKANDTLVLCCHEVSSFIPQLVPSRKLSHLIKVTGYIDSVFTDLNQRDHPETWGSYTSIVMYSSPTGTV